MTPIIVGGAATLLELVRLSDSPLAKCNDGSTAVYYRPPAQEQASNKWMIYLKGGGYCVPGSPLTDITVTFSEKEPMGFTLHFHFAPNQFFTNSVLTKCYEMKCEPPEDDPFSFEVSNPTINLG